MKPKSIYIGIDLATTASKTGCCILAEESDGTLHSLQNELVPRAPASLTRLNTEAIVAGIATLTRTHPESDITVAIDAPFSWPVSFKQKVGAHCIADPSRFIDPFSEFRFRETDRFIMRVIPGLQPLSVSSDRIGVVAMVASNINQGLMGLGLDFQIRVPVGPRQQSRPDHSIIEVYPAASLRVWLSGLSALSGYKSDKLKVQQILAAILKMNATVPQSVLNQIKNDHDLDALISAVTGKAFFEGNYRIPDTQCVTEHIMSEGWIWFPKQ